jgi:hypothetical protein
MGKAKKGQFKDVPVDEMMRALFKVKPSDAVQQLVHYLSCP